MGKKVLILSGSPRKGGNSDLLCDEFMRGALEAGHQVEKIRVASKKIAPCSGCYYCRNHGGECARKDDMAEILQKMIDTDVLVLATPVYFYSIDAQLKTLVDRSLARWREVRGKELKRYDFSGKRVRPFCTHEGGGFGRSLEDIRALCPGAVIGPGIAIRGSDIMQSLGKIEHWAREKQKGV